MWWWNSLLYDVRELCAPVFCRELCQQDGETRLSPAELGILLVSSGRAGIQAPEAVVLGPGSLAVYAGALTVTPATDCHILCAGLCGLAARHAARRLQAPLVSDGKACPLAAQELAALAAALAGGAPEETLAALGCRVLCAVARADEAAPQTLPPLVAEAVLAIRQNYAGLYGVEELSQQLGVSKSHLVRVFSAAMGQAPGQYLTHVRLEAAKALLAAREYPLETVAALCGFSGANYFCKVFKKHAGCTPAAWRAQNAGAPSAAADTLLERALYT